MTKYITNSDQETRVVAERVAREIKVGVIALFGELGAGKTTFVQGFAKGLKVKEKIISPTFVLIREHPIPESSRILYHIDLYRLDSADHLNSLGLDEILSDQKNLILIEWAEKLKKLPDNTTKIHIKKLTEQKRLIKIL